MSLEAAIAANTAALEKLTALFQATAIPAQPPKAPPAPTPKAEKPAALAPKAATPAAEPVKYEAVAAALTSFAKAKGRDAALALIGRFDHKDKPGEKASNGQHLKPADYATVLKALSEAGQA